MIEIEYQTIGKSANSTEYNIASFGYTRDVMKPLFSEKI